MPRKGVKMSPEALENQKQAIRRWQKEKTSVINVRCRNEKYAEYKALAERMGKPLATLIKQCLDELIAEGK